MIYHEIEHDRVPKDVISFSLVTCALNQCGFVMKVLRLYAVNPRCLRGLEVGLKWYLPIKAILLFNNHMAGGRIILPPSHANRAF